MPYAPIFYFRFSRFLVAGRADPFRLRDRFQGGPHPGTSTGHQPPPPIQAKAPELPSELPALQSLPKPKEMEEGIFKERLYSLSYREAEVRDVLMAFSRESSYNIIVDPEVSGKVTVDLKKVTLARALDSLIRPLGLDFKQEGRFIYIVKPKMETRMYHLNYLAVIRSGSSVVSGTGGAGASTTTTSGGSCHLYHRVRGRQSGEK